MADGTGRLTVRRSKTDQTSGGRLLYLSVTTMAKLDAIRPVGPGHGHGTVFGLSSSQIGRRISLSCWAAGRSAVAGHNNGR